MFKLLKLAFYALVGYAIYEFIRGVTGGEIESAVSRATESARDSGERSGGAKNVHQRAAARPNMTGPGQGQIEETEEADGGSVRHAVGRGVVRR